MSIETTTEVAKQLVRELFSLLGIEELPAVSMQDEQTLQVTLTMEDPKTLIGERGQTLFEIQHLLRTMLRKKLQQDPPHIFLDINDYRKSKEEYLRDAARQAADEAVLLNKSRELGAMSAADRRIVHMELAQRSDVTSESIGEGEERRVVIKPRES
ncbi:MAG: R3H domain-containing nucleic acid-binding protein [bacterium]|nr:R3H domain-containing nucleic acid-binding protein [bacterium]